MTDIQTMLEYYTQQSKLTTPGQFAHLFDALPNDISGLCKVVQGLIIHYRAGEAVGYTIQQDRLLEVDMRYVEKILARLIELDDRPLTESRPVEKRFVGCCRDFAVLFCAMARHKGIPCRVRVGFAAYINIGSPGFNVDHEIAEYWDTNAGRWRLIDPEQTLRLIEWNKIDFDVTDIPRHQFIVGGQAWQASRKGEADPMMFGVAPDDDFLKGWWLIRNRLMVDFIALNRTELLLWDSWAMADYPEPSAEDLELVHEVARLTEASDESFDLLRGLYEANSQLRPPHTVMVYSPVVPPYEATIEF